MQIFVFIIQVLKVLGKFIDLMRERDEKKAKAKELELNRLTHAAKETDPKKRASKLNRVLDSTNRL
jgi:hypothetical protein